MHLFRHYLRLFFESITSTTPETNLSSLATETVTKSPYLPICTFPLFIMIFLIASLGSHTYHESITEILWSLDVMKRPTSVTSTSRLVSSTANFCRPSSSCVYIPNMIMFTSLQSVLNWLDENAFPRITVKLNLHRLGFIRVVSIPLLFVHGPDSTTGQITSGLCCNDVPVDVYSVHIKELLWPLFSWTLSGLTFISPLQLPFSSPAKIRSFFLLGSTPLSSDILFWNKIPHHHCHLKTDKRVRELCLDWNPGGR